MNTRFTGIAFGTGPVGYQADKDEKIREVVKKIEKETEEAGLPWWAGLFNPEIVKLASGEGCECNCATEETTDKRIGETKIEKKIEAIKEENKKLVEEVKEKRRERFERMDKVSLMALEYSMGKVADAIGRADTTIDQIIELSKTMAELADKAATMRMSMGLSPSPYMPPVPMGINRDK